MKPAGQRAVIIFIDNSAMSIDGDFLPNRLTAQIKTVERYAQCLFSENASVNGNSDDIIGNSNTNSYNGFNFEYDSFYDLLSSDSLIAIGTIGSEEFGIRTSFTSNYSRLEKSLSTITSGGTALLDRAIRLGFMTLNHAPLSAQLKMIFFLNSSELNVLEYSLDDNKVAELNKKILENKKVTINFIVIGETDSFASQNNNILHNLTSSNSSQNIPLMQPNALLPNLISNHQFYIQNQPPKLVETTTSKRSSKNKKNSSNKINETCSVLQRIIKKAKNASIMIVHTCNTILSDVVMATELGHPLPSGSQIIYGAPASGSRKQNKVKSINKHNNVIFDPGHEFELGCAYNPRINLSNVNIDFPDVKMVENEIHQSQISPVPLASSASIPISPPAIKKERRTQTVKSIVFTNPNSDTQNFAMPSLINSQNDQPQPKQTRGRKPKYSASCPANQVLSTNAIPPTENNPAIQQILLMNSFNNNYNPNIDSNINKTVKNSKKASLANSSSISVSSSSQSFPPVIQSPITPPIPSISSPINISNQKTRKNKTVKNEKVDKAETENAIYALNIEIPFSPPPQPVKRKQTRQAKPKKS